MPKVIKIDRKSLLGRPRVDCEGSSGRFRAKAKFHRFSVVARGDSKSGKLWAWGVLGVERLHRPTQATPGGTPGRRKGVTQGNPGAPWGTTWEGTPSALKVSMCFTRVCVCVCVRVRVHVRVVIPVMTTRHARTEIVESRVDAGKVCVSRCGPQHVTQIRRIHAFRKK